MSHEHFNYGDASYSEGSSDSDKGNPDKKQTKDRSGAQRYISNACRNCRALHRRCDGRANCNNCKKRGIVCEYGEPTKRGPKSRKSQGDENYRDQSSKRAKHRRVVHNNMHQNNGTQLYSNKNPFAESKQDSAAELSEPFEVLDARILHHDYSGGHAPYYTSYDSSPDRPLLDAAWSDLLQTWAVPVPSLATHLPHPLTGAHTTHNSSQPSLPTSTLHLLTAENLRDLLPLYQPQLLAAHAYRGVLLAFGFMVQNQRNQATQMMNAALGLINFLRALGHTAMLDLTILLATAQIFGALFYINEGKSGFAARLVEEAFFTCQSFNGTGRIPVNLWQKTYVLRAALEDKDQALWEGYSWQIIEDKSDPGSERPYDLLTHIVLVFLVTSNAFKDVPTFNLPQEPAALHARMGVLKQLEGYVKNMPANAHYQRQISLASFFLYSTMALVYLQYVRLHEIAQDEGYRHVQECLTEAREHLTRVMPVKCCPALALALSLDISIVKKLHEHGKEVPQTLEAWALLHTCHSPLVDERDKYPDNYGKPLHKLFASAEQPAPKQYSTSYYQPQPQFYPPTSVPSPAQPPKSLAGYTTDQSYRNTPWSFNEQYSKSIVGQYQQYTRPNYSAQPANNSPTQPQQYPSPNMGKHSPNMSQYASHSFSDHSH